MLKNITFGPNQFAYIPERGARDALAYIVLVWITAIAKGQKAAVYCSDVSGAFDRVARSRLIEKMKAKKIDPELVGTFASWLRKRRAKVLVRGCSSQFFDLENMVFQGTVWGPIFWNLFYEDARRAIHEVFFKEIIYADDLTAYRVFPSGTPNSEIHGCSGRCQEELHEWGKANHIGST